MSAKARGMRLLRALCPWSPALAAVGLYLVLPHFPQVTETVFSRGIFRFLVTLIGVPISFLPVSLTEILAVLALPAVIALAVWRIWRRIRKKRGGRFWRGVTWVLCSLLLLYMLLHGVNFYRTPLSELMELDTTPKDAAFLQEVCIELAERASAAREETAENDAGVTVLSTSLSETLVQAGDGYSALTERYAFLKGAVTRVKPVQLSHRWSYTGITGTYFPMLAEANVNIDVPAFSLPATAAHEIAHTRGFSREDECNFLGFLSCMVHPSADYRYSGYLFAYIYCSNALYEYDEEAWYTVYAHCSDGVRRDLVAQNEYWAAFKGPVQEASSAVNDEFLQAQGTEDGVLSYNRVVELLLAYYETVGLP